eukprot:PITA_08944
MASIEMEETKKHAHELLNQGVIRPSFSPCDSPIVLVPTKDDTWRMCVDYRALNKIMVKNRCPLPRIDELLDQLKNVVYFTKLDLRSGYHQYWRRFIANFFIISSPLHALTSVKKAFHWGGKQQKSFDTLKEKISTTPMLALPDLQQPFEIETDASGYAMGVVLMQQRKHGCYHLETFSQAVVNYPTHDKELYALVQSVKKWKHYLIGKETIIHTDHHPLQYLQSQTKLRQSCHFRWMGFLQ